MDVLARLTDDEQIAWWIAGITLAGVAVAALRMTRSGAARRAANERRRAREQVRRELERQQTMRLVAEARMRATTPPASWAADPTVRTILAGIRTERAYDRLPVLADALEDTGCDDQGLLVGLRTGSPLARAWVDRRPPAGE